MGALLYQVVDNGVAFPSLGAREDILMALARDGGGLALLQSVW